MVSVIEYFGGMAAPRRYSARKVAVYVAIALILVFAFAASSVVLAFHIFWADKSVDSGYAASSLTNEINSWWGISLPPYSEIQSAKEGGMHGGQWWYFRVSPENIDRLKADLISHGPKGFGSQSVQWVIDDRDDVSRSPPGPSWWTPEKSQATDYLRLATSSNGANAHWFAFSHSTGKVFMYQEAD